jgi:hypothetical protein
MKELTVLQLRDWCLESGNNLNVSCDGSMIPATEDFMFVCSSHALETLTETILGAQSDPTPSALQAQVGGTHYKDCAIQPVQFIEANSMAFLEGCVVKRLTRHDKPSGKGRQDIEKAIHELTLLLELRYPAANDNTQHTAMAHIRV